MKKILVMNGPNLNMLGIREKGIYGTKTLEEINDVIKRETAGMDVALEFYQSNHEGDLIDKLHSCYGKMDGIVLNAGAYTHYSYAIRDAIASVLVPCVEVHLSDIHAREDFRSISVIEDVCVAQICGMGEMGYVEAIKKLMGDK
ncbi:MAG: type II 3-dehydroquinate dehydratase [Christensenella sp.]|nr:type II 3-dehydroquinate dehydratase [Christensenella sp.]